MKQISKVNILAAQYRAADKQVSRSESMTAAWKLIKENPTAEVITFQKVDGKTTTTRVISRNWTKFQAPKGGESKLKEGQFVAADLSKVLTGCPNCVISIYTKNIIPLAA